MSIKLSFILITGKDVILLTIKEAIRIKTGEAKTEQILSDFKQWMENEISSNILRDKINLAEFVLTKDNVLKYGVTEIKLPKNIMMNWNFIGHLIPYINSLCEEHGLEQCLLEEHSLEYDKEDIQFGRVIRFKI